MKKFKKLFSLMLVLSLVMGSVVTASAATNINVTKSNKTLIKKTGTYTLTNKSDFEIGGFRFKAPKSGYYTFTFTDLLYKGEMADSETEAYWDQTNTSIDYNCDISVNLATQDKYGYWDPVYFGDTATYYLVNPRSVFYYTWLNGGYEDMREAAAVLLNEEVSEEDIVGYCRGAGATLQLKVKMNKGAVLRVQTQGDKLKTTCKCKISYSKKE